MLTSKLRYEAKVLLFGVFDISGKSGFTFSSFDDAKKSRDLILMDVCQSLRPFCIIKFIPVYPYSANQFDTNDRFVTFMRKYFSKKA